MADHLFCFCGYPITVEDVPSIEGERQVYSDSKTGSVIDECPGCGDSPLDISRLSGEPDPIGEPYSDGV